jgi:hypothetical protein
MQLPYSSLNNHIFISSAFATILNPISAGKTSSFVFNFGCVGKLAHDFVTAIYNDLRALSNSLVVEVQAYDE